MADYKLNHTGEEVDSAIDKANTADSNWSTLMANLGIGRWANQAFLDYYWESSHTFYDNLLPYYGNDGGCSLIRFMANSSWNNESDITFGNDFRQYTNIDQGVDLSYGFYGLKNVKKLYLGNCQLKGCYSML